MTTDRIQHDYRLVCDARDHGSRKAYADLMAAYREPLYLLLLRMTRNTTVAADITVDTFSKAFLQLHRYSPTSTFSAWLYKIGINTYIDHLRHEKLDVLPLGAVARNDEGDFVEYQVPSDEPNPEEAVMLAQRDETVRLIVDQLKEPYREIVKLRYYDDLSYEEIADRLAIPIGTVKVRLSRAKALLAATAKSANINR